MSNVAELSNEIIQFLIDEYAVNKSGIKWIYSDFNQVSEEGDWANVGGMYVPSAKTLLINKQPHNLVKKVLDVIHEIQHYNQHYMWERDDSASFNFIKGKKLPSGKDEYDVIYEMSYEKLHEFWIKAYGYEKSPIEVDARNFAKSNIKSAINKIKIKFLKIK